MPHRFGAAGSTGLALAAALAAAGCGGSQVDCKNAFTDVRIGGVAYRVIAGHGIVTDVDARKEIAPLPLKKLSCDGNTSRFEHFGIGLDRQDLDALGAVYAPLSGNDVSQLALVRGGATDPIEQLEDRIGIHTTGLLRLDTESGYSLHAGRLDGWDYPLHASCRRPDDVAPGGDVCVIRAPYGADASLRIVVKSDATGRWPEILTAAKTLYDGMQHAAIGR